MSIRKTSGFDALLFSQTALRGKSSSFEEQQTIKLNRYSFFHQYTTKIKIVLILRPNLKWRSCFKMVHVAQLVRASDCGSEGRGFKSHPAPNLKSLPAPVGFFAL
jgi:hypothetical protein